MIDCIIKLGGAAITVKDQIETLQPDTIAAVADLISRLRTFGKSVIIVHGAGSFGHQHAAAAGLGKTEHRLASPDEVAAGVAATRLALLKLHQAVLSELISKNVPAVGLSPLAMGFSSSKSVEGSMFSTIPRLLSRRLVPVLHGDVVLDNSTKTKFSIFGGDVIMTQLCREFEPQFAVFLISHISSCTSIYTRNHKQNQPQKLRCALILNKRRRM